MQSVSDESLLHHARALPTGPEEQWIVYLQQRRTDRAVNEFIVTIAELALPNNTRS